MSDWLLNYQTIQKFIVLTMDSENLIYSVKLSFNQIYLLLELIGTQTCRVDASVFDNVEIEELSKIAKLFRKFLFI